MKKIYLIAAVIALAAGLATYFFASELKESKVVTGVDMATVIIAVEDIDENTVLTKEMFTEKTLPASAVPYGSVTDSNDVIGYMTLDNVLAGEILVVRKIGLVGSTIMGNMLEDSKLSYQLENGYYAYTIMVNCENGVGYFINENDKVNVYDALSPSPEPVVENALVLKVGDYAANLQANAGTPMQTYTVMTLALTKEQIAKIMAVEKPDGLVDNTMRVVLVSYIEAYGIDKEIEKITLPEILNVVPQTNYGMGEIVTEPPTTEK